jgi:MFS family permease
MAGSKFGSKSEAGGSWDRRLDDLAIGTTSAMAIPRAATEQKKASGGTLFLLFFAFVGLWIPVLAPLLVTLSLRVNELVGPEQAGAALGAVVAPGALAALLANPIFGRLSDRTTSRFGKRRPWILIGAIGGSVGTITMAFAPNLLVLGIGFCVSQFMFNACVASMYGILADQIPASQRGLASGLLGAALPISLPAAAFIAQLVAPNTVSMFLIPLIVGVVPLLLLVALLKDRRLDPADKPTFSWSEVLGSFWVNPLKNRDFGFAWWARFVFVFAYAILSTYQAFFLINALQIPAAEVAGLIFQATLALSAATLLASLIGGRLSDKLGRRKIFVIGAAIIYGIGIIVITQSSSFDGFLVGIAIAGFGFGWYIAVDVALIVDVLPDPKTAGKDLAVANIASTLPQSLAPAVAPLILAASSQSYPVLYLVAAGLAIFSALFILPIKGAR